MYRYPGRTVSNDSSTHLRLLFILNTQLCRCPILTYKTMESPGGRTPVSSSLVNIIDCRAAGRYQPLLHQVRNSHSGHRCHCNSRGNQCAQMSGVMTAIRSGVESGRWQFPTSSHTLHVEMRQIQDVDPHAMWLQVPTVVIVVYDAADGDSMKRLTAVLAMKTSTWLPESCLLALACSGTPTDSGRPVRRLKSRAKKHMGTVQVFGLQNAETTMKLLQWTLVVAATHTVTGSDQVEHETSFFDVGGRSIWSKILHSPSGTTLLRKVASKLTLRSSPGSSGTGGSDAQSTFVTPPHKNADTLDRPSTAPNRRSSPQ